MKKEVRGRNYFSKYGLIIDILVALFKIFPMRCRIALFESNRNVRGLKGIGIRYVLLKSITHECGKNVAIFPGAYILHPQNISFGDNISIHPMCYIDGGPFDGIKIIIGNDVSIAHGVTIMTTTHNYSDTTIPIRDQGYQAKTVQIKNNVWIGAKATILYGVTIESGCVIGANAVVTKDTQMNKVYAGVPSKPIKDRG